MVFNATFNNISVISCRSVLLVVETGVPGGNHRPAASHEQTLSHTIVSRTPRLSEVRTHNFDYFRFLRWNKRICIRLSKTDQTIYNCMWHDLTSNRFFVVTAVDREHLAWARFELTTLVVIGTDSIGSCKSNYDTINTTTVTTKNLIDVTTNNTDRHDITEILLKVALNTINKTIFFEGFSLHVHSCWSMQYLRTHT
jgi:hypothetical protein